MFFTQEDYKKIYEWISRNSIRDTEFNEALTPLNETDTITLVQNGANVRISLKGLVDQLFQMGVSDFLNITDKYREKNITLDQAIELIPYTARKVGQVITFLDTNNKWKIYQFRGELTQWDQLNLWEDILDIEAHTINSILPDEEDLTKSLPDDKGNSYLSFKDREYNPDDFSGLGRIILRKNIVEVEDPIYGKVKKNVLYQDMINKENTIYVIQYNFTLGGDITIPDNCVLEFDGGSISGEHTLTGTNTGIQAGLVKVFNTDITLAGTWNIAESYPEWFGAAGIVTEDATSFVAKAYSLNSNVCLTKEYYLPNGFELSNSGSLFSKTQASIKLGAPIKFISSYTHIYNLSFSGISSINAFEFGETIDSPDIYESSIENCVIQTFGTAFKITTWTGNLTISRCTINNTNKVISSVAWYQNRRFNICLNETFIIYTNYFGDVVSTNINVTNCYIGVSAKTYYMTGSWNSSLFFTRCTFELAREVNPEDIPQYGAPLIYIQGIFKFSECHFVSNTATHLYWFGGEENIKFELDTCSFNNFNSTNKIEGVFYYGIPEIYGHLKIKNIRINGKIVKRGQDIPNLNYGNYCYFNFLDNSGISIYGEDYDISKMSDNCIYKVYENNINGDYLYSIIKNGSHILKLSERQDNFLPHAVYRIDIETISRPIGFNVFNAKADRPSSYLEYSNESVSLPSFKNETKYVSNTCVQGNNYRIILTPNLISEYAAPLFSAKLCKNNTADSDDDIVLNLKAVRGNGEVYADFTAPNNTVYPYIKLTNTSNVYADGHIIKIEKGFLEADGEISGINRSGTFSNVPTPRHKGFAYFATDKGVAGVGAMIYYTSNNTTPWVYADGTAVS